MSEELEFNFSEMTENELYDFKEKIEKAYEKMCNDRAKELKEIDSEDFDPFSFFGGKKIDAIAKKYAEFDDGFAFLMEELLREFQQRKIPLDEIDNLKYNDISDEEYIYREIEKTNKYKSENKNSDSE